VEAAPWSIRVRVAQASNAAGGRKVFERPPFSINAEDDLHDAAAGAANRVEEPVALARSREASR
jgi:hypothetical protein